MPDQTTPEEPAAPRRRKPDALARSEERFRDFVEAVPDAILEVLPDGSISLANGAAERLFGCRREEIAGRPVEELLPQSFSTSRAALGAAVTLETAAVRTDGSRVPVELHVMAMHIGTEGARTCILQDISGRKRLEEQYLQAQKLEALGRLAGGVAHDFNNLLTIISGYSQMAFDALDGGNPVKADIEAVIEAATRATDLTHHLLAFSRRQLVQPKVLDLNRLVRQMGKILERVIGEDIELTLRLSPALGRVEVDPGQMEQVLVNLAVNARDAMPAGGVLTIGTANILPGSDTPGAPGRLSAGRAVVLSVTDTGTGMTAETRSHIFEPFFTTKPKGKGTGLGLASVYGIVKQSGGEIAVETELGKGTTILIYLPCLEAPAGRPRATVRKPPARGGGAETILVVEDEPEVRRLACEMLVQQGYHVIEAGDGEAAIELWRKLGEPVDLLLTDVVMPHMSGPELASHLTELCPALKVLYMSGYSEEVIATHGVPQPGAELLHKPFTKDSLGQKVRRLLDREA